MKVRIEDSDVSDATTRGMDNRDTKLNVGGVLRSAATRPRRRVLAKPSRPDQAQATADAVAVDSIRWAEFRLVVVGHLIFRDVERGKLRAELESLSAKKWKHPISGKRVIFSFSTIERWYYSVLKNPEARLRAPPAGQDKLQRCLHVFTGMLDIARKS